MRPMAYTDYWSGCAGLMLPWHTQLLVWLCRANVAMAYTDYWSVLCQGYMRPMAYTDYWSVLCRANEAMAYTTTGLVV